MAHALNSLGKIRMQRNDYAAAEALWRANGRCGGRDSVRARNGPNDPNTPQDQE